MTTKQTTTGQLASDWSSSKMVHRLVVHVPLSNIAARSHQNPSRPNSGNLTARPKPSRLQNLGLSLGPGVCNVDELEQHQVEVWSDFWQTTLSSIQQLLWRYAIWLTEEHSYYAEIKCHWTISFEHIAIVRISAIFLSHSETTSAT